MHTLEAQYIMQYTVEKPMHKVINTLKAEPNHYQRVKSPTPIQLRHELTSQQSVYSSQGTGFPTLQQTYLLKEVLLRGPGVVSRQRWLDFSETVCVPSQQGRVATIRYFPNEMDRPKTVTSRIIKQYTVTCKALATLQVIDKITTLPKERVDRKLIDSTHVYMYIGQLHYTTSTRL